jgi:hypothetical protein
MGALAWAGLSRDLSAAVLLLLLIASGQEMMTLSPVIVTLCPRVGPHSSLPT